MKRFEQCTWVMLTVTIAKGHARGLVSSDDGGAFIEVLTDAGIEHWNREYVVIDA